MRILGTLRQRRPIRSPVYNIIKLLSVTGKRQSTLRFHPSRTFCVPEVFSIIIRFLRENCLRAKKQQPKTRRWKKTRSVARCASLLCSIGAPYEIPNKESVTTTWRNWMNLLFIIVDVECIIMWSITKQKMDARLFWFVFSYCNCPCVVGYCCCLRPILSSHLDFARYSTRDIM